MIAILWRDFPITREANKVAHELARLEKCSVTRDWFEEAMINIVPLLINNVTAVLINKVAILL